MTDIEKKLINKKDKKMLITKNIEEADLITLLTEEEELINWISFKQQDWELSNVATIKHGHSWYGLDISRVCEAINVGSVLSRTALEYWTVPPLV